jgi:hypothetical protein
LEKQTVEFKSVIDDFDNDIRRHSKEDDEHGFEASKPNPEDRSEYMEYDSDFQEEFNQTMNDPKVPVAEKELDIPRDGDEPAYVRGTKRLRTRTA